MQSRKMSNKIFRRKCYPLYHPPPPHTGALGGRLVAKDIENNVGGQCDGAWRGGNCNRRIGIVFALKKKKKDRTSASPRNRLSQ